MIQTKTLFYCIFISTISLTACQSSPPPPVQWPSTTPWQFITNQCHVQTSNSQLKITTSGPTSNNILELHLEFTTPTITPPKVSLTQQGLHLPVQGSQKTYTVKIPFQPYQAANLFNPSENLQIHYQPSTQSTIWQQSFPTEKLMLALTQMATTCP